MNQTYPTTASGEAAPPLGERILRLPAVQEATGLGRSAIYDRVARREFPQPVRLTGSAVGWLASEIAGWIAERKAERERAAA